MGGTPTVGPEASIQAQVLVAALRREKEALELQGELALQLIQSATVDPAVGSHLDLSA